MQRGELLGREAPAMLHRHRQRIADRQQRHRRRGGREPQRTRLRDGTDLEDDVRLVGERIARARRHRHDRRAQPADRRQQTEQLVGLPAVRKREHEVAGHQAAEVAVQRFGGVQVERGRSRRGERRGDLLRDEPRLSHPGDDDAPGAGEHHLHRAGEPAVQARAELRDRLGFRADHLACVVDDVLLGRGLRHAAESSAGRHLVFARGHYHVLRHRVIKHRREQTALDAARLPPYLNEPSFSPGPAHG